jgi:hypothetical protein
MRFAQNKLTQFEKLKALSTPDKGFFCLKTTIYQQFSRLLHEIMNKAYCKQFYSYIC